MKKQKNAPHILPREEWPYEVPENWVWTRLGELCNEIQYGYTAKAIQNNKFPKMLRITDIQENQVNWNEVPNCEIADNEIDKYELLDGDIVFARTGATTGKSYIINTPPRAVYASYLIRIRLFPAVINNYAYHFLQSSYYWNYITEVSAGIAQPGCNAAKLAKLPIPLPPIPEQQRIVARIESLFAKLDDAAEKIRAALDQFPTRKAAILHKAFTGELTKKWREENGVGMESWKETTIGKTCTVVRGGSPRPAGDEKYYNGTIPFMKVADITRNYTPFVSTTEYTIKEAGLHKTRMVEAGTLLLTNSGATLGVPAICTIQTTFNDGIAAFLDLEPNNKMFFYYFFTSKTHELRSINQGAAQPNLNIDIINSIQLKIPTLPEQTEIVRILDAIFEREQAAKEIAERLLEKIALTKKAILARAFRGKLGTNDPAEASAAGLLT